MLTGDERQVLANVSTADIERLVTEAARIPSYSPPSGHEQDLADFFAAALKATGVEVEVQQVEPRRPNVIGVAAGRRPGKSLLFNGHIDTTPPVLGWSRDPYGGLMEGDRLYGHGVSNMKASDVAMIAAVGAVLRSRVDLAGRLVVSLVMGECTGGKGTKHMLQQGLSADCFINGEPTDLRVLTLHAGVCRLELVVTGRSHHFGTAGRGVNAIEKMMKILGALGESLVPIGPDGWLRKRTDRPEYEGFPRFNIGAIRGGLTRDCLQWGPYNTPDCCVATLDVRYPPGLSPALIQDALDVQIARLAAADPDVHAEVKLLPEFHMPPYETSPDDPITSLVASAIVSVTGQRPEIGAIAPMKFMGADAGALQAAGIPGVMCGIGTFTGSVPDEYIELSKLVTLTRIYALAAYRATSSCA